jgi:hypothetical protein
MSAIAAINPREDKKSKVEKEMHVAVSKCCDVLRHYVTANKHTNRTE